MRSSWFFLAIVFSFCLQYGQLNEIPEWDVLIFTQRWPAIVCKHWKDIDVSHRCIMPNNKQLWTIHGIWPSKLDTIEPTFCNRSWLLDQESIKPIEDTLTQLWPSIQTDSLYSFLSHEWIKHGTCTVSLEPLNTEYKYFSKGIDWLSKYLMNDILEKANISPSDTKEYSVEEISHAIRVELGVNPYIQCWKKNGKSYLEEIRLCFNKNLDLINCNSNSYSISLTNCDGSTGVLYVHYNNSVHNKYLEYGQNEILEWDLLIFTQSWPAMVCKDWIDKDNSHRCIMPKKKESWTVHGIWPTKWGTIGPGFCNRSWHFNQDLIRPIENTLIQLWPHIESEKSIYSFWSHEWIKHGTCAASLESLNSEYKYFSKGVEWINKYLMTDILEKANISPSDTKEYSVEEISHAIRVELGVNPYIKCWKKNGKSYLKEIRLCFNKNLDLINCNSIVYNVSLTNCDESTGVLYVHYNNSPNNKHLEYGQNEILEWDLLIFTQSWPAMVCKDWIDKDNSHRCIMPKKKESWTVHGIWPTKLGTIGPGFCNRSWHFNQDLIRPIENTLIQLWPNIESEKSIYSLWSHEWIKHGTCAASLEPLNSEYKYFSKGIEWINKYLMTNILENANISPSDTKAYLVADISHAVKVALGVNPHIQCRKAMGKSYLEEIRICFNKNLELMDCNGIIYGVGEDLGLTNCDGSADVLYIHYKNPQPSNRFYIELYKAITWLQWFTL